MNMLTEVDIQRSIVKITDRLPMHLQNRWRKKAVNLKRKSGVYPDFAYLVNFVDNAAEESNDSIFGSVYNSTLNRQQKLKPHETERRTYRNFKSPGSNFTSVTSDKKNVCALCSKEHKQFGCDKFKVMKPEERIKFVRSKRLCDNCLSPNHIAAKCLKQSVCSVPGCGKKHTCGY